MNLNVLFVDDDEKLRTNLVKVFDQESIEGHTLIASQAATFDDGKKLVGENDFDIVILDLYKGEPKEGNEKLGIEVLKEIQSVAFIPVIFYTGLTKDLAGIESEVVGVVNKGEGGIEQLKVELTRIIKSNIALIKRKVNDHVRIALRDYFWKTVHDDKKTIDPIKNDISIGYLLLRRLAHSLSKENIKSLLSDDKIQDGKAHPMEFYIYPSDSGEYVSGEILKKDNQYYAILTPDCDFVLRANGRRKAEKVLLASAVLVSELDDFKNYSALKAKVEKSVKEKSQFSNLQGKLKNWMGNKEGEKDRYFFLPGTPFIDNLVLDFQNKTMVNYEDLKTFQRIAKLDTPFAQSMVANFTRYYNRIGFPDIDTDYILNSIKLEPAQ
jgi:CheY-like chemotaxis protein